MLPPLILIGRLIEQYRFPLSVHQGIRSPSGPRPSHRLFSLSRTPLREADRIRCRESRPERQCQPRRHEVFLLSALDFRIFLESEVSVFFSHLGNARSLNGRYYFSTLEINLPNDLHRIALVTFSGGVYTHFSFDDERVTNNSAVIRYLNTLRPIKVRFMLGPSLHTYLLSIDRCAVVHSERKKAKGSFRGQRPWTSLCRSLLLSSMHSRVSRLFISSDSFSPDSDPFGREQKLSSGPEVSRVLVVFTDGRSARPTGEYELLS